MFLFLSILSDYQKNLREVPLRTVYNNTYLISLQIIL